LFELLDYDNSLVSLSNSILKYFGAKTFHNTLPQIDTYFEKDYKNVVVLLLDGLGKNIIDLNTDKNSLFQKNMVSTFKSVMPPTTVCATTSFLSGLYPKEHSWLGWDCYFKDINKTVTVFLNENKKNGEKFNYNVAKKYLRYKTILDIINQETPYKAYYSSAHEYPNPKDVDEVLERIKELSKTRDKKFIYAYIDEPDSTMHKYGIDSKETKDIISILEKKIDKLLHALKDTLFIIIADHGQVNAKKYCLEDYSICDMLKRELSIDSRCTSYFIKDEFKDKFKEEFIKIFKDEFYILDHDEAINSNLFGNSYKNPLFESMIGDYLVIAKTNSTIMETQNKMQMVGVHSGYTLEEITIPLIVIEK
jgi:predicted AlkP superfamily pyrophosphatase or phosphodiesterase